MKIIYIIILFVVMGLITILVTDMKILLSEIKINPGQEYYVQDYGNLGDNSQASLVCNYFNGRKTLTRVFWYSSNNILGKDSCPFLLRD